MLILNRKLNESIILNGNIELVVTGIKGDSVKIGINAPLDIPIYRKEVFEEISKGNTEASSSTFDELDSVDSILK